MEILRKEDGNMLVEILCQKKSFQKYWRIYVFCFAWFCFFMVHHNTIQVESWFAYGMPFLIVALNTVIVFAIVLRLNQLMKTGTRVTCKIVHSISDFNNGVLRIRCSSDLGSNDDTYQFEEKVMVPFVATSTEIDSIYKQGGRYFDIEYIEVLVNPVNPNQYEILYYELLNDETRKSKYQLFVMGILFLLFMIVLTRLIPF